MLNPQQVSHVENLTRGQRDCPYWLMYRKGRLTSSNFGLVLRAIRRGTYPPSLYKTLLGEYSLDGVKAIQWGMDHEDTAVRQFVQEAASLGIQSVGKCGLFLDNLGILGASPDRVYDEEGLLEIKCPFVSRNEPASHYLQRADSPFKFVNDLVVLNPDHTYYHQIQGQLYLTGRSVCYLVIWTTKNMAVCPISKDTQWEVNLALLRKFYKEKLLPKMLEGGI